VVKLFEGLRVVKIGIEGGNKAELGWRKRGRKGS